MKSGDVDFLSRWGTPCNTSPKCPQVFIYSVNTTKHTAFFGNYSFNTCNSTFAFKQGQSGY